MSVKLSFSNLRMFRYGSRRRVNTAELHEFLLGNGVTTIALEGGSVSDAILGGCQTLWETPACRKVIPPTIREHAPSPRK